MTSNQVTQMKTNKKPDVVKTTDIKYLIHIAITILLMFVFRFLPASAPLTDLGMAIIGVFIGLIYGWTFCGILWPSVLGIVALGLSGYMSVSEVMSAQFSNPTLLLLIVGLLALVALAQAGIIDYVTAKLISARFAQGKPMVVVALLMTVGMLLSSVIGSPIVMILFATLATNMFKKLGYKPTDKFCILLVIGLFSAANLGIAIWPFLGWALITLGMTSSSTGVIIPYFEYMIVILVFNSMFCILYPFFMKLLGADFSKMKDVSFSDLNSQTEAGLTKRQKTVVLLITLFFVFAIGTMLFDQGTVIGSMIHSLGILGGLLVLLTLFLMIKIDGEPLIDMKDAAAKFSWEIILLFGIALVVSAALTSEGTGVGEFFMKFLVPIFNALGPITFLIALAVAVIIITNIANNVAVAMIFISIIGMMHNQGIEVNVGVAATIITIASINGILTPASSIVGAMIHSHPYVDAMGAYKYGLLNIIYLIILISVIMIPMAYILL
jgi:sodium-dependent dicarboxylate transporter 2/3/5